MTTTTAPSTAHVDPFAREHLPPPAEMPAQLIYANIGSRFTFGV